MAHWKHLENSKLLLVLTIVSLVSTVTLLDVGTGDEVAVSSLFLLPVTLASWTAGRKVGFFVSIACAVSVLGVDLWSGRQYRHAFTPFWNAAIVLSFFVVVASLVTNRRRLEGEQEARLQEAIASVKTLRGLIPVCAWCKKIRDDRGYWSEVEAYVAAHTEADFTHGVCPDCAGKAVERARSGGGNGADESTAAPNHPVAAG